MKNKFKLFGLAVLVTAIVFSFAACKNNTTPTPTPTPLTDPALNGTWKHTSGATFIFNNGNFELPDDEGSNYVKGTFTTSGSTLTLTTTHMWGTLELFEDLSLQAKWYSKAELIAKDVDESYFTPWSYSYSISGNTLTLIREDETTPYTYTKQ